MIRRLLASPAVKVMSDFGLLAFGQVATKAITFLAFAILARRLDPASYGAVEYALGMATFAALAIDGGLGTVGVRRLTQGEDSAAHIAALVPTAQLCIAGIAAPGMVLFAWLFAKDAKATQLVCLVALSVLILPWKQDWLFQALGKMGHIVAAQTIRTGVFLLGAFLLVSGSARLNLVGVLEISSVACASGFLLLAQHRSIAPVRTNFSLKDLIGLGREGVSIGAGAVVWAMVQYAPLMMLANMSTMTDTAYFGAAHRLGVSMITFSWLYHFNLFPLVARRMGESRTGMVWLTRASFRAAAWGGIALALGLTLAATPLLALMFGPRFTAAADAFSLIIWTFPVTILSGHTRGVLLAARRPQDMLVAQVLGAIAAIIGGVVLIPRFAAAGAGASMLIAALVIWAGGHLFAMRQMPVPFTPCLIPAGLAGAVLIGAKLLALSPWVACGTGLLTFLVLAPLLDRTLVRELALIVKAPAPNTGPASPPAPSAV